MGYKQLEGLMRPESQRAEKELGRTGEGLHALERRIFARHAIFCVIFVLLYLLLNQPEVIMLSKLGYSAWYPATGLVLCCRGLIVERAPADDAHSPST
jgi:hypothetical protein